MLLASGLNIIVDNVEGRSFARLDTLNVVSINSCDLCLLQTISIINCIENVVDIVVFK